MYIQQPHISCQCLPQGARAIFWILYVTYSVSRLGLQEDAEKTLATANKRQKTGKQAAASAGKTQPKQKQAAKADAKKAASKKAGKKAGKKAAQASEPEQAKGFEDAGQVAEDLRGQEAGKSGMSTADALSKEACKARLVKYRRAQEGIQELRECGLLTADCHPPAASGPDFWKNFQKLQHGSTNAFLSAYCLLLLPVTC